MDKYILPVILTTFLALSPLNLYAQRAAPWVGKDLSGAKCKGKGQGVGPFDYTSPTDRNIHTYGLIVRAHFNDDVRTLRRGQSADTPPGDLDYTLRGIPNHHLALDSMMRYQLNKKNRNDLVRKEIPPTVCYLLRAINFAPKDYVPHLLLGNLYTKTSHPKKALISYKNALKIQPDSSQLNYNIGLLYMQIGQPENALPHAKRAYDKNYPFMGLKKKLIKSGVWRD